MFTGMNGKNHEDGYYCNLPQTSFIYFDSNGTILDCCERLCKNSGVSRLDLLGHNLFEIKDNQNLLKTIQGKDLAKPFLFEGMLRLPGANSGIQALICLYRFENQGTNADQIVGFIDLTSSQNEFIRAMMTSDHFRIIAENSADAISLHELNGKLIYMSPSIVKLNGYSSKEIGQMETFDTVFPDDIDLVKDALHEIGNGHDMTKVKYRLVHKSGNLIWVESTCQSVNDKSGKPYAVSVVTRNINIPKLIEDSLKLSEEKYRTLVKYLPTGILLLNTSGEILEVNQALLDILGSPGEEPTRSINLFKFENLVNAGISADLMKCIQDRKVINGQAEYISKWGKKSYLLYSAVPVYDSTGEITQVIGNVRDVTRIKRAEEKSQQQIDFLNIVINTIQEPFFVKDEHHRWIMLNDAAIQMMGHPREELIGKSDYELYPKKQADIFWEKDSCVFENGSDVNEETITWSDGSERTIITNKQLYTESNTGKKYIVGTIHDISEIKDTLVKLGESERKYHDLFDNANDFIFTTDLNGVFTNANKALLSRLNIKQEELGDFSIYSFCKPDTIEYARAVTAKLMEDGTIDPFEIQTPEVDGKSVTLEIRARMIYEKEIAVGIQGIARDVSEKKLASEKLEKVNKELHELNASKDKFYSIIAHDLKNPFNSLIGFSELLLEDFDELSKDEMRDYVGIIRNTARNSLILLENLLAWSRLQTGRMVYNPANLVLANEVDATTTVLYSLAYRKKIEVDNMVDKSIQVKADQNMLLSILHNLLMNAIKFTPQSGKITIQCNLVSIDIEGSRVEKAEISVTDTGIGMSAEDQAKLFSLTKPFTMPGTEKETGTGLGLLLTKEMVEKHGGIIKIKSQPGKGSTFSFQVPVFVP